MMRTLFVLLLLANAAFFAWSQGHLAVLGFGPKDGREPQRMAQQVRPEAVVMLGKEAAQKAEATAKTPPQCLVSEPLSDSQVTSLREGLGRFIPASAWAIDNAADPALWIVYMGKYPNDEALEKKRQELSGLGVKAEVVRRADLRPGLSLGEADSASAAQTLLAEVARRGVRTARVVQEREERPVQRLKLPAADASLNAKLADIRGLAGLGAFQSCKPTSAVAAASAAASTP
jgi:hypothetical protein